MAQLGADGTVVVGRCASAGTQPVEEIEIGPIVLESGETLPSVTAAYRHDGPGPGAPQTLVVHALTGSADAAGDWWAPLIGPGRAIDTARFGVLCANLLGGYYGSTGPTSLDPTTGQRYGASFPSISPRDQAMALWRLADRLAIEHFALVTGGSLGGMVATEVAMARPRSVDVVVPIAAPAAAGPLVMSWNHIQRVLIERLGSDGLALARQLAMTTYRSEADFDLRFGRTTGADGQFAVVSYLEHQGRKLVDRFDRDTYRTLLGAMDRHDIGHDRGGVPAALADLAIAGTVLLGVGIAGDILYGPSQVRALVEAARHAGVDAIYRELATTKGHDAFLVEWDQLAVIMASALAVDDGRRVETQP